MTRTTRKSKSARQKKTGRGATSARIAKSRPRAGALARARSSPASSTGPSAKAAPSAKATPAAKAAPKAKAAPAPYEPPIRDDAVLARTGKSWNEWFRQLDAAGAKKMTHPEIARHLHDVEKIGPWWSQMVTVVYEQARGLREKHERPVGFEISVGRTIEVSNAALFRAWRDSRVRGRWLPKVEMAIRKAATGKSMRITWADGKTELDVNFYAKGAAKSQLVVQHSKLADAKEAAKMKAYWSKALDRLREVLEG